MLVEVFYGKNDFMRNAALGAKWMSKRDMIPSILSMEETHEKVYEVEKLVDEFKLEDIWIDLNLNPNKVNTENFSTEDDGVWHQSMSIGDIIMFNGKAWMCDYIGCKELS